MFECRKYGCKNLVEPDIHYKPKRYCPTHEKEAQEHAIDIFGREAWNTAIAEGRCPITILHSGGSVRYVPDYCERCNVKFKTFFKRLKKNTIFDKIDNRFLFVCKDCIKMTDAK